ncbi:hypothetical protein AMURIS_05163 [Acetatifactor muris]|uniref:Uncharacterized protein n=1 Tax=Acetatifactor muris TaxID=879566 RepID=A0A2K4ZPI5_9FIRM|nr:hypothetical protein AMURIS_05163 [Acetatifactor muris]
MPKGSVGLAEQLAVTLKSTKVDINLYTTIAMQIKHKNMGKTEIVVI